MRNFKVRVLVIILIIILLLGGTTFAVLYFATDIFKSDKDMFYKYAEQINFKDFIDLEGYDNFIKRVNNEGHENEGTLSIDLDYAGTKSKETIKYTGYTNIETEQANYEISINKDDKKLLEMNYLKNQDFYGILFKDILSQYIVVENRNIDDLATKLGLGDFTQLPIQNTIQIGNYAQISSVMDRYVNVAMEAIPEEKYSKAEKQKINLAGEVVEADGYKISLNDSDVKLILQAILNSAIQNGDDCKDIIASLYNDVNINSMTITVYKQNNNAIKLSINTIIEGTNNIEIALDNTASGKALNCTFNDMNLLIAKVIDLDEQEKFDVTISQMGNSQKLNMGLLRVGAFTSNNVTYSISIPLQLEGALINIDFKENTNFAGTPQEAKFETGKYVIINELSEEQLNNLAMNLVILLNSKLKDAVGLSLVESMTEYLINNLFFDLFI